MNECDILLTLNILLIHQSAILKAIAEKLVPGIPIPTRISILQQTATDGSTESEPASSETIAPSANSERQLSVLEEVIDRATSRNEIQHEIDGTSHLIDLLFAINISH
jgi:hypothetical protein